jgi:hypothetical protein
VAEGEAMRKNKLPIREIVYVRPNYEDTYAMLERNIISIEEARELLGINQHLEDIRRK